MSLRTETPARGIVATVSTHDISRVAPLVDRPTLGQTLRFTRLNLDETEERKKAIAIHNAAWRNEALMRKQGFTSTEIERSKALEIDEDELRVRFALFPEGQIVGRTEQSALVSMLNTRLIFIRSADEIRAGYKRMSSEPMEPDVRQIDGNAQIADHVGILVCFSIVTDPQFQGKDVALATLAHGIEIASQLGLAAVPYSAPRGFGAYRKRFPEVEIMTYLHITKPAKTDDSMAEMYRRYTQALERFNNANTARIYTQRLKPIDTTLFTTEAFAPEGFSAYSEFKFRHGSWFRAQYGREPTVVDYIRITGRQHVDPVMNMHIQFGADFIYDRDGRITCVFEDSRSEDVMAGGYNVALTYHHRNIFV